MGGDIVGGCVALPYPIRCGLLLFCFLSVPPNMQ